MPLGDHAKEEDEVAENADSSQVSFI